VTRFVVDCDTLLRIAAGDIDVAVEHQLVAPPLVRSQALAALYGAAVRGEISASEGMKRLTRIDSLKVRFLGDKVLQRQAWKVASQMGWQPTYDAEYVALTSSRLTRSSRPTASSRGLFRVSWERHRSKLCAAPELRTDDEPRLHESVYVRRPVIVSDRHARSRMVTTPWPHEAKKPAICRAV
jgi:indolepyruvate ferredoxin oxidoreductase alpha subunit